MLEIICCKIIIIENRYFERTERKKERERGYSFKTWV